MIMTELLVDEITLFSMQQQVPEQLLIDNLCLILLIIDIKLQVLTMKMLFLEAI